VPDLNKNCGKRWFNPAAAWIRVQVVWIEDQEYHHIVAAKMLIGEGSSSN
jgi:hypothetical protein